MLTIKIPSNHLAERRYIIEVIFVDFLGLEIILLPNELETETTIQLDNNNQIIIEDHFFSKYHELDYLQQNSIPTSITYFYNPQVSFLPEENLPILYGRNFFTISNTEISCGADVFASAFYMLSRWEEYVLPNRDMHDRFPYSASLACKFDFHHRPIVNEYVEFLWAMLQYLGYQGKRKERKYEVVVTHDVDVPLFWKHPTDIVKKIGGDILKRASLSNLQFTCNSFFETVLRGGKDPYDTFDFLMDVSERHNIKSRFYFLVSGKTRYDKGHLPPNHPFIQTLFQKINDRGHIIGFHPSYATYDNVELFRKELNQIQSATPQAITQGRQHFLRFEVPKTWRIWEENLLEEDSSLYYSEKTGFRAGVCYSYHPFDFLIRQKLKLLEAPLLAMEVSWAKGGVIECPDTLKSDVITLKNTVSKYKGCFTFLWHNSSININGSTWKPYYEALIKPIAA